MVLSKEIYTIGCSIKSRDDWFGYGEKFYNSKLEVKKAIRGIKEKLIRDNMNSYMEVKVITYKFKEIVK